MLKYLRIKILIDVCKYINVFKLIVGYGFIEWLV